MSEVRRVPLGQRIFRTLLRLFPAEFRRDHGRDMEQIFRLQSRDAARSGSLDLLRLWWSTLRDVAATAPGEHLRILREDSLYAWRMMAKNRGLTGAAVLTLALGIGAATAVFSVVHQVLFRPLPYEDPERLVYVHSPNQDGMSGPSVIDLRQLDVFDGVLTMAGLGSATLGGDAGSECGPSGGYGAPPQRVRRLIVSANYFDVLGVQPLFGRGLRPDDVLLLPAETLRGADPSALPVGPVVISHQLWQQRFGGDFDALGELVEIDGRQRQVIGILPPDFRVQAPRRLNLHEIRHVWYLSNWDPALFPRNVLYQKVLARLALGVSLEQAQAEVDAFAERQASAHEIYNGNYRLVVESLHEQVVVEAAGPLWLLFGAVALVLLIAASNAASLLLAGGQARLGELGVRAALGAGRERLVRQLMTESLWIALAASALGVVFARLGLEVLLAVRPETLPRFEDIHVDPQVLLFAIVVAAVAALGIGVVPAYRFSAVRPGARLTRGRRSLAGVLRRPGQGWLVAVEIALSFVLVVGAGLLIRTFWTLHGVDPGFDARGSVVTYLNGGSGDTRTPETRMVSYRRWIEAIEGVAGVEVAGLASNVPFDDGADHMPVSAQALGGREPTQLVARVTRVTPGVDQALGLRLLAGSWLTWDDLGDVDRPVVVLDEALVERLWPASSFESPSSEASSSREAVGRRMRVQRLRFDQNDEVPHEFHWAEVVGVVRSVYDGDLASTPPPAFYLGYNYVSGDAPALVLRSPREASELAYDVRTRLAEVAPMMASSEFRGLDGLVRDASAELRFSLTLLAAFGVLGVLLAAAGLYALLAGAVRAGLGEIGIRRALGADGGSIVRLVLGQASRWVLVGVVLGAFGALASSGLLRSQLHGVEPTDPLTYLAVAALLLLTALCASLRPIRRALRADPLWALRAE